MTGLSVFFSSRRPYFSRKSVTTTEHEEPSSDSSGSRHRLNHRRHFLHDSDNHNIVLPRSSCVRQHRTSFEYDLLADSSPSSPDLHPPSFPDQQPSSYQGGNNHYILANRNTEETLLTNIWVRPDEDRRLPGPVLLARQRLIEKLNGDGVCHSGNSRDDKAMGDVISPTTPHSSYSDGTHIRRRLLQSGPPMYKKWNLGNKIIYLKEKIVGRVGGKDTVPSECSICLEEEDKSCEWTTLLCGHRFHLSCLNPWLQVCGTCPYCRTAAGGLTVCYS